MDKSERVELLRKTELFRGASTETLSTLAAACELVELKPGEVVFEMGSTDDGMYFVADGELDLYAGDATLDRLVAGNGFGEMALLTEQPRTASVRSASASRLLRLSRAVFRDAVANHPETALGVIRDLATKIRSSIDVRVRQHESLRSVRDAFERSVSKSVMDEILASANPLELMAGKETRATIAFADIRGFTTIAEGMSPSETIRYLNSYLGALVDVVFDAGGTVDKFIGDAVMAYFGAPLSSPTDALRAVECALAMPEALQRVAQLGPASAGRVPQIGVGLATGAVVAGCVGNARRMEYTVMSDTVNLASRIEGLTKSYGSRHLMCGETARSVTPTIATRLVDVVRVKGKTAATELHDVVANGDPNGLAEGYARAFAAYRVGDFSTAARLFRGLISVHPSDGPSIALAERCDAFRAAPPHDWDGVFVLTNK